MSEEEFYEFYTRGVNPDGRQTMPNAHYHNHNELYYLISGQTNYMIGSDIYILEAGDLAFIPKGVYHQTDSKRGRLERVLISFDDEMIPADCRKYLDSLYTDKHIRLPKDEAIQRNFHSLFMKIEEECKKKENNYKNIRILYLTLILAYMDRYRGDEVDGDLEDSVRLIRDIAKFISENKQQNLTLDMVAQKCNLSPCYFSKLFKKISGIGFSDYLNITRVAYAQEILASRKIAMTELAAMCGYNDSNYFSRVFKQIVGVTPKKYAETYRKK